MIVNIGQFHPIFRSDCYLKDVVPFNLMEIIKLTPMLLVSNGESFIVGMTAPQYPVWVWTADGIANDEIAELCEYFYNQFQNNTLLNYVAKPSVAKMLSERFVKEKNAIINYVNMESYECPVLIPTKNNKVVPVKPCAEDLTDIADCLQGFYTDCFYEDHNNEECLKEAQAFILKPISYVIKQDGKVVSMACSARKTETHMAVNHVYTKPEFRNQGLASVLVAHICKIIFENNKIPLLYTDLANPSSNKAYQNIGFVERGKTDEITLKWGNINV